MALTHISRERGGRRGRGRKRERERERENKHAVIVTCRHRYAVLIILFYMCVDLGKDNFGPLAMSTSNTPFTCK